MHLKTKSFVSLGLTAAALAAPAAALAGPYDKGPDPTAATLTNAAGFYGVTKTAIADAQTPGFGSATVWSPKAPAGTTFGAVAISPGWTEGESAISWLGPRLAAQGFVVITFNNLNAFTDYPVQRGEQINAALAYLTSSSSPVRTQIDPQRVAAAGHSMGGGGALEAAKTNPNIDAVVALTPWDPSSAFGTVTASSLIVAAENDWIAPAPLHARPFYGNLPAGAPKAYLDLKGADHFTTNTANDATAVSSISWLKRYVDGDTRYTAMLRPTLVGAPAAKVKAFETASVN